MSAQAMTDFTVQFNCDRMSISVGICVPRDDNDLDGTEQLAIKLADELVVEHYGFSPFELCQETFVDYNGEV